MSVAPAAIGWVVRFLLYLISMVFGFKASANSWESGYRAIETLKGVYFSQISNDSTEM
jgi:hypothetical protein